MSSEDKTALEKLEEKVANQLKPSTLIIGIIIAITIAIGQAFATLIFVQPALEQVYSIYGNILILGIFLIISLVLYFVVYQREEFIADLKDQYEAEKEIRRPKTVKAALERAHRDLLKQVESTAEVVAASSLELGHLEEQRQANANGKEVTAFKAELKDKRDPPPLDEKQHLKGEIDKLTDEFNPTGAVTTATYNLPITDNSNDEVSFNFRPITDPKAIDQFKEESHSEIEIIPVPPELIQEPEPEAEDDEVDLELSDETLEALEQAEEKPLGIVKEKIEIPLKSSKILTDESDNEYIERADGTRDYNV